MNAIYWSSEDEMQQTKACLRLWRHVLYYVLNDALNFKEQHQLLQEEAYRLITSPYRRKEFQILCAYAAYDDDFVREKFLKAYNKKQQALGRKRAKRKER